MRGQVAQWIPTAIFSSACWPCKPTFRRKGLPPKHPDLAESDSLLGACLTYRRRYAEAEPLLLAAYEQQRAAEPGRAGTTAERLVKLYEAWGKPDQAARWRARVPPKGGAKGKG